MRYVPAAAHRRQPWKNGLGESLVIADDRLDAGFDALRWQVSATGIAADCPFSALPGLDRLFVVLEGAGAELSSVRDDGIASTTRVVLGMAPHAFRGDWTTLCRLLGGPVRVLNVIARRGVVQASLRREAGAAVEGRDGERVVAVDPVTLDAWDSGGEGTFAPPVARDLWVARLSAA